MAAPKTSESDIAHLLTRLGVWHYKLADIPVPFWDKTSKQYHGNKHLKQKPFDIIVIGGSGGGAIEVKSGQLSFSFLSIGDATLPQPGLFCLGFGPKMSDWPDEMEKRSHGIKSHQRRGLTRMYLEGGHPWLALMMGTGTVKGKEFPRKMWLVPWLTWVKTIEMPLLELGQTSLPYDPSCANRVEVRKQHLTATEALSDYELFWNPEIEGAIKWDFPIYLPLKNKFMTIFGQDLTHTSSQQRAGLTQKLLTNQEPTVLLSISALL